MKQNIAINIENLNFYYKNFYAIKDINLQIYEKEFVILKGVSGSGKSTLLSLIGAMQRPNSGKIEVFNEPVSKMPDIFASHFRLKHLGFIFQHFNLIEEFSVYENLKVALIPLKISKKDEKEKIEHSLKSVGLLQKKDNLARNLSGGEKQRVSIARAIISNPKIILADEPTANLDLKNSLNIIKILKKLNQEGTTIVVSTHDDIFEKEIQNLRVINIHDGSI
jgi:putative ABC transport system ATP-binding protein